MRSTRTTLRVLQRRQDVATRYLRGESQAAIARDLGVTQQQISLDLQAVHDFWLTAALRDTDALKAEQLAKVDAIEAECWQAWRRSQQGREVCRTDAVEAPAGPTRTTSRTATRTGDPRFLDGILKCVARR